MLTNVLAEYTSLRGHGEGFWSGRAGPRRLEGGGQRAAAAQPLLVASHPGDPVPASPLLVGGADQGHAGRRVLGFHPVERVVDGIANKDGCGVMWCPGRRQSTTWFLWYGQMSRQTLPRGVALPRSALLCSTYQREWAPPSTQVAAG